MFTWRKFSLMSSDSSMTSPYSHGKSDDLFNNNKNNNNNVVLNKNKLNDVRACSNLSGTTGETFCKCNQNLEFCSSTSSASGCLACNSQGINSDYADTDPKILQPPRITSRATAIERCVSQPLPLLDDQSSNPNFSLSAQSIQDCFDGSETMSSGLSPETSSDFEHSPLDSVSSSWPDTALDKGMSENQAKFSYISANIDSLSLTMASPDPKSSKNVHICDITTDTSSTSAKPCQLSSPTRPSSESSGSEIKEKKKNSRVTRNGFNFKPLGLTGASFGGLEKLHGANPLAKVEEVSGQLEATDRWRQHGQEIHQESAVVSTPRQRLPRPLLTSDPVSASYIEAPPRYCSSKAQPWSSSTKHCSLQRRSSLPITAREQVVDSSSEEDSERNSREGSCGKLSLDGEQADGGDKEEVITCSSSLVWKSPLEKDILCSRLSQRLGQRGKLRILSADDEVWMRSETAYKRKFVTIPDPNNQSLVWTQSPQTVLIIRKHQDETVLFPFRSLVIWLVEEMQMVVFVEAGVLKESMLKRDEDFQSVVPRLKSFKEGVDDLTDKIDFIICLGGDGTLLYVSSLFQASVPPVIAFNMGSLGFLTPFEFYDKYQVHVSRVIAGKSSLLLRYRLKCVVVGHDLPSGEAIPHVKNIQKEHSKLKAHKLVLNEVVIDRGSSSYLSNLDLYIEGRHATCVQGDGLIISTPTGSTAYAVAAGASMVHPSVPCILVTPICPHSLSFRPIVVPAGVEIRVMINPQSRGTAMVSFDGRDRIELNRFDSLRITTASYPVPSVCESGQIEDWLDGLAVCLNWNLRRPQHAFTDTTAESTDSEL